MVAGRVVRFDSSRGYGFIAPDDEGEDVFLHVNDLRFPEQYLRSGLEVEFEIEEGDRGLKAAGVRLADGAAPRASVPGTGTGTAPARPADGDDALCDVLRGAEFRQEVTEVLLGAAPTLTGEQILQVREGLLRFSRKHGWVEG
ncbi:cold shock domain-containing protein [Streptomyces sp. NPDC006798]|uniref:cold-shock protein n=1 Tax=Streptomyces sp. NPDC006798 TaxID=3155462 RepID=UPI0033F167F2